MASGYGFVRSFSLILCFFGLILSIYSFYVEVSKQNNPNFKAFCDISATISCSKVFTSKYGRGFGLVHYLVGEGHWLNQPNSALGIIYYVLQIMLGIPHSMKLATCQILLSVISNIGSVYLGYILLFVLEDICIVCFSIYVINFCLLLCNMKKRSHLANLQQRVKTTKKRN